jgi:hypothetical protein
LRLGCPNPAGFDELCGTAEAQVIGIIEGLPSLRRPATPSAFAARETPLDLEVVHHLGRDDNDLGRASVITLCTSADLPLR